jgi:hypothetical protein
MSITSSKPSTKSKNNRIKHRAFNWTDATGNETGAQSSEWFAGYFSANVTGYPNQNSTIDEFFRAGSEFIDSEMERVASNLKGG